jgi:hypothetical protein
VRVPTADAHESCPPSLTFTPSWEQGFACTSYADQPINPNLAQRARNSDYPRAVATAVSSPSPPIMTRSASVDLAATVTVFVRMARIVAAII